MSRQVIPVPFEIGLTNKGNTCFVNSMLQCLFHIEELESVINSESLLLIYSNCKVEALKTLKLFAGLLHANHRNQKHTSGWLLSQFIRQVQKSGYQENTQQDSHEYMIRLIDWLEQAFNYIRNTIVPTYRGTVRENLYEQTQTAQSLLNQLFIGFKQITVCENGHQTTQTYPKEFLALRPLDYLDINDCINNYFGTEHLPACSCAISKHSCNAFLCATCNKHVRASLCRKITSLPDILIIQLCIFRAEFINNQYTVSISLKMYNFNFYNLKKYNRE